jgi:hypothetical protein
MSNKFALGKKAFGFCDRCGQRSLLAAMRSESVAGRPRNNKVCRECFDADHPQNWQGKYPVYDPQALRNPRPDTALEASREIPDNGKDIEDLYVP